MNNQGTRRPVAVLGATGMVGQRLVQLLDAHPWFELAEVAASDRSAGRPYGEAVNWRVSEAPPAAAAALTLRACDPAAVESALVFSALDAAAAEEVEPAFARAGRAVISNARNRRMDPDVPLIVPEANADHLALIEAQRRRWGGRGFVVCNPNCSVIGLALALAPLARTARLERLVVTTLQAASGAGYPGVPALDLIDNVIPWIADEEPKLESEPAKIFGKLAGNRVEALDLAVSAQVHRVPVSDGHLLAVSLQSSPRIGPERAAELMARFRGLPQELGLPSAPDPAIVVREASDRPQPRLDRMTGGGMAAVVGRIRPCAVLGLRMEVLSHNTIRGAAGGTLLIGELIQAQDLVP
ncbi:MAG: aspartate-semialdehyde dehydrogenase [Acidobacteria bacterium]|nr:aspartate-semialdehyde dehydrogenase [Acidobacteriota bacterium]